MSLTQTLKDFFSKAICDRGRHYFQNGYVRIKGITNKSLQATVRGSETYTVSFKIHHETLIVSCSCPYFDEDYCKHIWATMLAAESKGYLLEASRKVRFLDMDESAYAEDDYFHDDDEFVDEEQDLQAKRQNIAGILKQYQSGQLKQPNAAPAPPPVWKQQLEEVNASFTQRQGYYYAPWPSDRQILYVVDIPSTLTAQNLILELYFREPKITGEWKKPKSFSLSKELIQRLPSTLDREIASLLVGASTDTYGSYYYYGSSATRFRILHPLEQILIPMICRSGRAFLKYQPDTIGAEALVWDEGDAWQFWVEVRKLPDEDAYRLEGVLRRDEERRNLAHPVLMLSGGLIFWPDRVARLDDHGAFSWIPLLRKEGALVVPASHKEELLARILAMPKWPRLDLPEEIRFEETQLTPLPLIKIKQHENRFQRDRKLEAALYFDYDGRIIKENQSERGFFHADKRLYILRDRAFEQAAAERLHQLGVRPINEYQPTGRLEFPANKLPKLARTLLAENWHVEAEGKLYRQAGKFEIAVSTGIDWFELNGRVEFGDTFAELPALLAALRRGEGTVMLDDGTFGILPEEWLKKYGMLAEMGEDQDSHIRFKRSQAGLLDALLASQPEATFDAGFQKARDELKNFAGIKAVDPPESFTGTLREYQREGLGWLHFLRQFGFGGCLADDMGLGKCLAADSRIEISGELMKAEEAWSRYATEELFDGEGYWSEVKENLLVNSLDERLRKIVQSRVRRLYRQRVRERLRTLKLEDGSQITITMRHQLLTDKGWTNQLQVGDFVCVPRRLIWQGNTEDPDLLKVLAWQIAEGYEQKDRATLRISQKDVRILEDLKVTLARLSKRHTITCNQPAIHTSTHRVAELTVNSCAYRQFLESKSYVWGKVSREKCLPPFVMQADAKGIREFLRNYFEAEASVISRMRSIEISSASQLLMQQLASLLRRFGVWMRISSKWECATNGSGIFREYWCGVIGGNSARRFYEEIGFVGSAKQAKLALICASKGNTNVEGIPASGILAQAVAQTHLPVRHFGLHNAVYLNGTQEFSHASLNRVLCAVDELLNGEAEKQYRKLKKSKWTEQTLAAYRSLDEQQLRCTRDQLQQLLEQEVFYCRIKALEEIEYDGWVYDLEVEDHHNFVANNILCHNTIQVLSLLEERRQQRAMATNAKEEKPPNKKGSKKATTGKASVKENRKALLKSASPAADGKEAVNSVEVTAKALVPSLVVVPKSLVFNWKQEAAKFTPEMRVLDHTGGFRRKTTEHFEDYDLILTTYGTLRNDALHFKDYQFDYVVLDESQAIKNANTESAKAARLLRGDYKLALSGTPIENHLGELWSLFEFLNPGLLGSASVFKLSGAGGRNVEEETRELLARGLRPFILRRTKDQVAKDLPEKLEQTIYCELDKTQRKLYNELRDHYRNTLLGMVDRVGINKSKIMVLEALLRLRQAACHPGLLDKKRLTEQSAKLDLLVPRLLELHEEGHKVLVFSQFTSFLSIVKNHLDKEKIKYEYLDGKTRDRAARVENFQNDPDCKLFLISLKAGGLGLNLTAAEYVFLLDPWWNPAVEAQAIDRAHRIGQTRNVFAYRLIARDTVEEKVLELQNTKRALAEAIINADNSLIRSLGRDDLELLLS